MKFRTRITIAFAVLSLLMISVELIISHLGALRNNRQTAEKNLLTNSLQVARNLDMLLDELSRDMKIIASSAFLNEPDRKPEAISRRLSEFCSGSAPLARISFLDTTGVVVADSQLQGIGIRRQGPVWQQGMAGKSGFLVQDTQGQPSQELVCYAPVQRGHAAQKGVVVATVPFSRFRQLINGFQGYRVRVELLDHSGRLLYTSLDTDNLDGLLPGSSPPVPADRIRTQQVHESDSALHILTPAEGLSSGSGGQWLLRITKPKAHIFAESRSRLQQKLLVNAVMFLAGVVVIYLLAGRLSRPLEAISRAVRYRGEGDLIPLQQLPRRSDEFALLQENLQEMSSRLHESLERLTISEERFHALFDGMTEGVALHRMLYGPDGVAEEYLIDEVNPSYQQILGLTREQVVGKTSARAYQVAYPPYLQEFAMVVATGQPLHFETYFDKLERHFSISCCRIGPERFATIFEDISARKWHEEMLHNTMEQLKAANEAKNRFLAVMSHEIRTPLNGITGMVQLLRDMEMPPTQREYLNYIDSSSDSLLTVINDILDFSKIDAGKLELEQIPFQPLKVLNDALRVMRLRAQAKGLLLSLDHGPDLPTALKGDPHRLTQVLNNLVGNAIKFTAGGEITVRAAAERRDDDLVLLTVEVQDPGIGMDEATQKAVFEPFIQADSSTTRKYGGTGLGLAICRQLVELMQGTISVTSRPGHGSTFRFSVPLPPAELPSAEETVGTAATTGSSLDRPLRILVAEDQPVNQRFVAEILRKQGHLPLLANNGKEAVEIWNDAPLDLVLMDIQMPVMDGLKALAAIRAAEDDTGRHTPVIALTAHAIVGDQERLMNAGFDGYLAKPLQVANLFEEMARVLEQISKEKRR